MESPCWYNIFQVGMIYLLSKANHFNAFSALHCTPLDNNSKIPGNQTYVTSNKFSSLEFEDSDITQLKIGVENI